MRKMAKFDHKNTFFSIYSKTKRFKAMIC